MPEVKTCEGGNGCEHTELYRCDGCGLMLCNECYFGDGPGTHKLGCPKEAPDA